LTYSAFAKNVLFTVWKIKKFHVVENLEELERTQWLTPDEIKKIQWMKLKNLLEYVYNYVPYYHKIFKKININPKEITNYELFRKISILTKEEINSNFNNIVSSEYTKEDLIKNSTGGSTGNNLTFFNDKKHGAYYYAIIFRNDQWAKFNIGDKHAYLWGSSFDIATQNTILEKFLNKYLFRSLWLSTYDLSEINMDRYVKKILKYKPKIIIGYSSPLYLLARFIHENKIEGIKLQSIISSAEVLFDYQREIIESAFCCKVFNRYGCREFGTIAQECSQHSGLHINNEHIFVECLRENGELASPGEKGELIITDLDNYAFPFIRYRIDDMAVVSDKKCICGRGLPLLETIDGRTFDITVGSNGRYFGGTFWTLLLRTAVDGIKQFQVIQEKFGEINIYLIVDSSFTENKKQKVLEKIYENFGEDMKVDIKIVDNILLTKSGKHRFIISKVSPFKK
jgi:phenylacetate-CoA ligase